MGRPKLVAVIVLSILVTFSTKGPGQSLRGEGHFEFFLDAGSLPHGDGKVLELFQIAIPKKEINYSWTEEINCNGSQEGCFQALVSVHLVLSDHEKKILYEKRSMILDTRDSVPMDSDLVGFLYLTDSCTVEPGSYRLSVRVEDLKKRQKTLLSLMKKKYEYSFIKDEAIEVRLFANSRVALSDPFLIWGKDRDGRYILNPIGIYGLNNDTLSVFAKAVIPEIAETGEINVYMTVIDDMNEVIDSLDLLVSVQKGQSLIFGEFDVNTYSAGSYRINIEVSDGRGLYTRAGKDFSIAWKLVNWQKPKRNILIEARIIFDGSDFKRFKSANIGEQEKILLDFWKNEDPTPHTAVNENYDIFNERVRYANANFSDSRKGALTGRGQTYIRFGPPDEIVSKSIPFNKADLDEAIDKLDNQYKVVIHNTFKGPGTEVVQMYNISNERARMHRGWGMDTGGYELWIYSMRGKPLFEKDHLMTIGSGLRFLFVDKNGIGQYLLVGTSDDFEENTGNRQ